MDFKRTFIFSSDYHFLPEGVKKIQDQFHKNMRSRGLVGDVVYRKFNYTFLVECPSLSFEQSTEVQKLFLDLYKGIILHERNVFDNADTSSDEDDEEVQTNSKVKVETKPKSRLVRHLDSDDEIRENDTNAVSSVSLSTTYPKDIRCFNSRQIWTCKNEHNMMDCIIPVQDQELIATLTGATLVQDLNHQRIFVGALSEESLHRAIHKLNNVRKYFFLRVLQVRHIFYSEDIENFQIALKPLMEVKKRLVETTLLDPIRRPGGDQVDTTWMLIAKTLTARCCAFNPKNGSFNLRSGKKLLPVTKEEDISLSMKLWDGYQYPKKGDETLNLVKDDALDVGVGGSGVRLGSPAVSLVDKTEDIKKWRKELLNATETSQQFSDETGHTPARGIAKESYTEQNRNQAAKPVNRPEFHNKRIESASIPVSEQTHPQNLAAEDSNSEDLIDFTADEKDGVSERSLSKPLISTSYKSASGSSSSLHLSALPTPKLQGHCEVESRKYHVTMRQGAPRKPNGKNRNPFSQADSSMIPPNSAPRTSDPIEEFEKDLKQEIETILDTMRNWEGEMILEAQFGRILIRNLHRNTVALGNQENSFDPTWMEEEILHKTGTVDFTKLMTAVPRDVEYLISMKDEKERKLWEPDPYSWHITYEIECRDKKDNTPFVVEIDAERVTAVVKSLPQSFSKVFVHCTLRNWDYCIAAEGTKNLEETYGVVGQSILDTLYIPGSQERITSMSFQIAHREEIAVTSIRIRRKARYMSLDRATVLNITEVNDLFINGQNIDASSGASTSHALYHGFTNDYNRIFPGPQWFEVGIMSVEAIESFKLNLKLEIGEEADWTLDSMTSKDVPSAIYKRACEMVKNMDGVGFWNQKLSGMEFDLPRTPETPMAAEVEATKKKEKHKLTPRDKGFW